MKNKQLKEFKQIFLDKKEAIVKSLSIKEIIEVDGNDQIDKAQANHLNEVNNQLSLRDKKVLFRIEAALKRIEDGSFGICQHCEEPINEKRLLIVPDSDLCIVCSEKLEKRERVEFGKRY